MKNRRRPWPRSTIANQSNVAGSNATNFALSSDLTETRCGKLLVGHASLQMTFDTYAGLFPTSKDEQEKMEKATGFLTAVRAA